MPLPNNLWSEEILDVISTALLNQGYIVLEHALPAELVNRLQIEANKISDEAFAQAAIGRGPDQINDTSVRTDSIYWVNEPSETASSYLAYTEGLRQGLNSRLFLGLFDYECQYACYAPGAFYKLHSDSFPGRRNRILSSVLYLNTDWQPDDGGQLVLYAADEVSQLEIIRPQLNTLVLFLSERFPHEVLTARRTRYSLTGWFRVNSSSEQKVDPPR